MRFLVSVLVLMMGSATLCAQTSPEPKCKLQDLAIEAALGGPAAQYDLGVVFFRGELVPQDYSKAAKMWQLAGEAGMIGAYNNLGFLTYYGKGVKRDYQEGVRLWRLAAEKGFAESQVHLAEAYLDSRYLVLDFVEAYAWAKTGKYYADNDQNESLREPIAKMAETALDKARQRLSPTNLAAAEEKARLYIAKYGPPR